MKFCPDCENYLKLEITETKGNQQTLNYKCNNCSYQENFTQQNANCIYKNEYDSQKLFIENQNLDNLFHDPTLPVLNNINCINTDCESQSDDVENNVLFIVTNKSDMKYLYICKYCQAKWTNN